MPTVHDRPIPSRAALFKHPLHPAVVSFPVAFLVTAVATDALYWWRGEPFWGEVSFYLIAAGFGTGVVAAALGAVDFLLVRQVRSHVAGWSHLIAGIVTLALAGANFVLRLGDPLSVVIPWGIITSAATGMVVGAAGWFGGELAFRHGIGSYTAPGDRASPQEE